MDYQQSKKQGFIHPELVSKIELLKKECKKEGIPIKLSEGYRTMKEQDDLYAQGRTKPGYVVTNAKGSTYSSQHQWGIAVDFYLDFDVDGDGDKKDDAFNDSNSDFSKVGSIAESIGLGWGGVWTRLKDKPHLYLNDWGSTTTNLKKLYFCPENFMTKWVDENKFKKGDIYILSATKVEIFELQKIIGAKQDGIPGPETLSKTITLAKGSRGFSVNWLQRFLNYHISANLTVDGIFGSNTKNAVIKYQALGELTVKDGVLDAGKNTWRKILGLI